MILKCILDWTNHQFGLFNSTKLVVLKKFKKIKYAFKKAALLKSKSELILKEI